MTPVRAPQARTPPILLSELDERIIRAAGLYGSVTIMDLYHLLAPVSYSTLRERARRLAGNADHVAGQYLFRFPLPSPAKGTHARVYCLGVKGRQFLGQEGFYRPSKLLSMSYSSLWHALTLTRCCVCASRLTPSFTLSDLQLCYSLARTPPRVTLDVNGEQKDVEVIPDALLGFVRSDGEELTVLLEVDRGTSGSRKVKAGLLARIELLRSGAYRRFFGLEAVQIAYLTTAGEARRDALELWTYDVIVEAISEEKHREGWLKKFFFTSKAYEELFDPALFTDPVWQCPAFETMVSLLPPLPPTNKETTHGHIPETTSPGKALAAHCHQTKASRNGAA
jgi:hypothetical protein